MSEATRAKALAKFARFRAMIGYPLKWRDYAALTIQRDSYFENIRRAGAFESRRLLGRIGTKIDRDEFTLPAAAGGQRVFPEQRQPDRFLAAILQPPFFDPAADDAVNYGGIGVVIGHEITHGSTTGADCTTPMGTWRTGGRKPMRRQFRPVRRSWWMSSTRSRRCRACTSMANSR